MADKDFEIKIRTVADTSGAAATVRDLEKVGKAADDAAKKIESAGAERKSFLEEGMEKAAAAAAQQGAGKAVAGVSLEGVLPAVGAAAAAAGVAIMSLREGLTGLMRENPKIAESFHAMGSSIRSAFQEVVGGGMKRALDWLVGGDFTAKVIKLAEAFGAATKEMRLAATQSADYLMKQKSVAEVLSQVAEEEKRVAQARKDALEVSKETIAQANQTLDQLHKKRSDEAKATTSGPNGMPLREDEKIRATRDAEREAEWHDFEKRREARDMERARAQVDLDSANEKLNTAQIQAHAGEDTARRISGNTRAALPEFDNLPQGIREKVNEARVKYWTGNDTEADLMRSIGEIMKPLQTVLENAKNRALEASARMDLVNAKTSIDAEGELERFRNEQWDKDRAAKDAEEAARINYAVRKHQVEGDLQGAAIAGQIGLEDLRRQGRSTAAAEAEQAARESAAAEQKLGQNLEQTRSKIVDIESLIQDRAPDTVAALEAIRQSLDTNATPEMLQQVAAKMTNMLTSQNASLRDLANGVKFAAEGAKAAAQEARAAKAAAEAARSAAEVNR